MLRQKIDSRVQLTDSDCRELAESGAQLDKQALVEIGGGVLDLPFGSHVCHTGVPRAGGQDGARPVLCPHCQSDQIIKGGKTKAGKPRYKCQNADCSHYSFQLDLIYKGRLSEIKAHIIDMTLNGSGIRDTARALKISPTTVINELKKKKRC